MAFALSFSEAAGRDFDALDGAMQERVRDFLKTAAVSTDSASLHGFSRTNSNFAMARNR